MRRSVLVCGLVLASFGVVQSASAQHLYEYQEGVETRWASPENPQGEKGLGAQANAGRKGQAWIPIKPGESVTLAEVKESSGTVRRIWVTIYNRTPDMLRGLKIEMFWDGAAKPAVSAPLGDFFGVGLGETAAFESSLFSSPEGRSFNCFVPMPFRKGMKIVVANESSQEEPFFFYDVDYTLGDRHDANMLYFHAHWRRENPTTLQHDFEILPQIKGKGRFLGANLGVIPNTKAYSQTWWGEGEVKVYLDGDLEFPTLAGTGTEDYIGTGWSQGVYSNLYQGSPVADKERSRWCFYRYHVPDPVWFSKDVRVAIQQIGHVRPNVLKNSPATIYKTGPGLAPYDRATKSRIERQDDFSSCAYFYLDRPENGLPPIAPVAERIKGL